MKGESASLTTRRDCRANIALNYCLVLTSLFQVSATHFSIFNLCIFPTSRDIPSLCCVLGALFLCDKVLLLVEVASLLIRLPDSTCLSPPFSPHTVSYFFYHYSGFPMLEHRLFMSKDSIFYLTFKANSTSLAGYFDYNKLTSPRREVNSTP